MALMYVPLYDGEGQPLLDDNGDPITALEDNTTLVGANGTGGGKRFDNRLWEIYQEEIAARLKPKPPPEPEPEPEVIDEVSTEPAPQGGFFDARFDAQIDTEFFALKARAYADARHTQYVINRQKVSEILRKARR